MKALLDTCVLIDETKPDLAGFAEIAVSTVSLAELHFGVLATDDPQERALRLNRVAAVEATFEPLPVTAEVARQYGALAAAARTAGRSPRPRAMDFLIAATAVTHGAVLITHNVAVFATLDPVLTVRPPR